MLNSDAAIYGGSNFVNAWPIVANPANGRVRPVPSKSLCRRWRFCSSNLSFRRMVFCNSPDSSAWLEFVADLASTARKGFCPVLHLFARKTQVVINGFSESLSISSTLFPWEVTTSLISSTSHERYLRYRHIRHALYTLYMSAWVLLLQLNASFSQKPPLLVSRYRHQGLLGINSTYLCRKSARRPSPSESFVSATGPTSRRSGVETTRSN